jgi:hypothetical protein
MSSAVILLQPKIRSGQRSVSISLQDESMEYLSGHVVDGRNIFPATGYLVSCITFVIHKVILFSFKNSFISLLEVCCVGICGIITFSYNSQE